MNLSSEELRKFADLCSEIAKLAPEAAAIADRIAIDPAMASGERLADIEIAWLTLGHAQTIAQLQARCVLVDDFLTGSAKGARKIQRNAKIRKFFRN